MLQALRAALIGLQENGCILRAGLIGLQENGCMLRALCAGLIGLQENGCIAPEAEAELQFDPVLATPGDLLLFGSFTPHRSDPNSSSNRRRALFLTFNALEEGEHRRDYYQNKKANMGKGRISLIEHFAGESADM
ncbi:hypothetical protein CYMTET_12325 [Cymbomonas tetramitiformis]|uniref:Phytanoyl-CoA dioxygenase n=1 Tax=Cymbomonas tetramitiformis TaxID=36881 RepID=A0AAE0GKA6_9CHLO|nr:hypothetical protein CYMTET_12325 [Cymbomonas tetramitiformis]